RGFVLCLEYRVHERAPEDTIGQYTVRQVREANTPLAIHTRRARKKAEPRAHIGHRQMVTFTRPFFEVLADRKIPCPVQVDMTRDAQLRATDRIVAVQRDVQVAAEEQVFGIPWGKIEFYQFDAVLFEGVADIIHIETRCDVRNGAQELGGEQGN